MKVKKTTTPRYTMSKAAHAQRKQAARKPHSVKVWKTAKVSGENLAVCRAKFGSVNAAINVLRETITR